MITIINKYTGEEICKYSGAKTCYATVDSFIANVKGSGCFRRRWNAIVDYFISIGGHSVQCLLKDQYAVKECMGE